VGRRRAVLVRLCSFPFGNVTAFFRPRATPSGGIRPSKRLFG